MVLKVPIRTVSIILGLFFCIYSVFTYPFVPLKESMLYESPLHVLIIDPGHGGLDGGAVSSDGVKESEINLKISIKLNTLGHLYGITTVMTRTKENIEYPSDATTISACKKADQQMRLGLIRDYPHGILYSIHQNYFSTAQPYGPQVLYGHNEKSRKLGDLLQTNLCNTLYPDSRRVAAEVDDNIYLMKHCNCISALIECGFLSNPMEAERLQNDIYQTKIASILLSSYLQYTTQIGNE